MEKKFVKAKNIKEALDQLSNENGTIIAGGTDLMVEIRKGERFPEPFIDISSISELKKIDSIGKKIVIGACCTHSDVEKDELIKKNFPMLNLACSLVGSTLIRNRGTIGGNIINNANCADSIPPLLIYDAKVNLQSINKQRNIDLEDLFLEKELELNKDEILKSIEIFPLEGYKWRLVKVGRRKSLSISRLTLALAIKENERFIEDIRICPGAMLPTHGRLWKTEERFKGEKLNKQTSIEIAEYAANEAVHLSGRRWSTEYKEPVLKGLIIKILDELEHNDN